MTYQQWAAYLRKNFPEEFGNIQDDRQVVNEAMDYWPETNYRDSFGDENYNELKKLDPETGGVLPRAGKLKQLA